MAGANREIIFGEITLGTVLFEGLVEIFIGIIDSFEISEEKPGSCTFAWSTNVTWLKQKIK